MLRGWQRNGRASMRGQSPALPQRCCQNPKKDTARGYHQIGRFDRRARRRHVALHVGGCPVPHFLICHWLAVCTTLPGAANRIADRLGTLGHERPLRMATPTTDGRERMVASRPAGEYKGWLSLPDDEGDFITVAFTRVGRKNIGVSVICREKRPLNSPVRPASGLSTVMSAWFALIGYVERRGTFSLVRARPHARAADDGGEA